MNRLTKKIMGKVVLPIIPMEIKSKEDLDKYHKVRREYENMAIKLAEYEDKEEEIENKVCQCEYCNPDTIKYLTDDMFSVSRIKCIKQVCKNETKNIWVLAINENNYIEITTCPICGRHLV